MAGTRDHSEHSNTPVNAPDVARPRGSVWRPLYADGISWEGQVFIVGADQDLAARLIVTSTRLALISGGDIALEIPRRWLKPDAQLIGDDRIRCSITPDGAVPGSTATDTITLIVRAGRDAAGQLTTTLTGRRDRVSPVSTTPVASDTPVWDTRVGAAPVMALPPLPEFDAPRDANKRAWPPAGPEAIPPPAKRQPSAVRPAGESIAAWTSRNLDRNATPLPAPVPSTVSRAATRKATLGDNKTVSDMEVPILPTQPQSHVSWVVRGLQVAILLVLLGTGWYFGGDRLASDFSFRALSDRVQELTATDNDTPDDQDGQTGSNIEGVAPTATTVVGDGTGGAGEAGLSDLGVGGATEDIPTDVPAEPTDEPAPTDEPTAEQTDEPAPTDEPAEPTDEPVSTDEPTAEPTDEPVPTDEPKAEPTDEPVPTNEPTAEPTVDPAPTSEPTPTTEPRETLEPTAEATGEPTPLPTATEAAIEPQAPSVDPSETPAQETVSGPFRIALEGAAAGEDVTTALPEIQPVTYGEWVVLSVYAVNESDTEQVFDMSQFSLLADGEVILLDTGSGWVNGLLGNTPAYSNTDSVLWAAGEGHQFALTFLAPIDATTLTLLIGDQSVDLSGTLTTENPISGGTEAPVAPDAIEGTVVDVLDGETIVVDIDGIEQNVTYLGVEAPRGDDCFASEATAANSALVTGQNVRLERQSTNTDAQGNWVRDVWVATESGGFTLVSQALVRDGAVNASISEPNTRFASWLTTSEASARGEGAGLWSACGAAGESGEQATLSSSAVIRPQLAFQ